MQNFNRSMKLARIERWQRYEIMKAGCTLPVIMVCFLFFGAAILIPFLGAFGGRTVVQSLPSNIPYATIQYPQNAMTSGAWFNNLVTPAAGLSGVVGLNGGGPIIEGGGATMASTQQAQAAAAAASTLSSPNSNPIDVLLRPPTPNVMPSTAVPTSLLNPNAQHISNDVSDAAIACGWWPQKCSRSWAVVPAAHPEWLPVGTTLNTKFSQCAATCARERSRCECTRAPLIL